MTTLPISFFIERTPEMIRNLQILVEMETPSMDKPSVDQMGAFIVHELSGLGASLKIERQSELGDHITGQWGDPTSGENILILCHMDTVYPIGTLQTQPWTLKDDRIFGPGVLDMKGGIVILLTVLEAIREKDIWPARSITALFTSDEEIGSLTSRSLIERLSRRSALCLCLESGMPDGSLKTWRKGVGNFQISVRGRSAHAGVAPLAGINAIEELAHQVITIQHMTDTDKGTTLNVGVFQGGIAANVVPDEAYIEVDLRIMTPSEGERITRQLHALQPMLGGTTITVKGNINRPPMPRDWRMAQTFQKAQAIASHLGLELTENGTGGASDANFVAPLGVPVLDGLGVIGEGAHSRQEFVLISSLASRAALLSAILQNW